MSPPLTSLTSRQTAETMTSISSNSRKPLLNLDIETDYAHQGNQTSSSSASIILSKRTQQGSSTGEQVHSHYTSSNGVATSSSSSTTTAQKNSSKQTYPRPGGTTIPESKPGSSVSSIFSSLIKTVEQGKPIGGSRHAKLGGGMMPPSSLAAHVVGLDGAVGGTKSTGAGASATNQRDARDANGGYDRNGGSSSNKQMPPPVGGSPRNHPYQRSLILSGLTRQNKTSTNSNSNSDSVAPHYQLR